MFRGEAGDGNREDRSIQVLHVDDESAFADLAATFLERENEMIEVSLETSVTDGLAYLESHEVDCVVSDFDMPERNGIDFLRTIREERPDLPFILFTGKGSEEVASEAISAGVTDYLQKESGTSQYAILANRIENVVTQRRSRLRVEESQKRLRDLIDTLPHILLVLDEEGTYQIVNETHAAFHGTSVESIEGKRLDEVHDKEVLARFQRDARNAKERGSTIHPEPVEIVNADGQERIIQPLIRPIPLDDGARTGFLVFSQDITDRAEEREELELHRTIVDAANTGIVTIDETKRIQMVNPAIEELFGYNPTELLGESVSMLLGGDRKDNSSNPFDRAIETMDSALTRSGIEMEWRHADGSSVPVSISFSEATYDDERVVTGFVTDISDRKRREKEAARSDALISSLFAVLPVGVLAEDSSRNVLAVNERMIELFDMGAVPATLMGADCRHLLAEAGEFLADSEGFIDRTNEIIDASEIVANEEWGLTDGTVLSRSHHPIDLPEGNGHLWVYHDVSERVEQRRRLEQLARTSQEIVGAESTQEAAERGVRAAREVLGLESNSIHLYDDTVEGLVPAASTESVTDLVGEPPTLYPGGSIAWEVFEAGASRAVSTVHQHQDVQNPDTPIRSELFLPIGDHGILLAGSTENEAFDDEDLLLGELLAGILASTLEEIGHVSRLRDREQELRRQNERLEAFTNIVSHDLRTPLNIATARHELARDRRESEHDRHIARAHRRMAELIDDLLDLAREEHHSVEIRTVDVGSIASRCWEQVNPGAADLVIETDARIRADPRRLQRMLENLLKNAVEHGGSDVRITIGDLPDGFYVEDNGPGISSEVRDRVFEEGFTTSEDGTGLGLGIVTRVVEGHEWELALEESANGGVRWEIGGVESAA